jgi:TonB family protein
MVRLAPSGETAMAGDVYLNQVVQWIQRRRKYPEYFRQDGLVGTASFKMTWARNGEIVELPLIISSGDAAIDLYAEEIIHRSSPLPPIPSNFPGATLTGQIDVPVQP